MSIKFATEYATAAHAGQKRKYTHEDYITHPIAVAQMVSNIGLSDTAITAAILHDTVEDTYVTLDNIERHFGEEVMKYVYFLTKPESFVGNRKTRKAITRAILAEAPTEVKLIKFLDVYHNHASIKKYDTEFFEGAFKSETILLLEALDIEELVKDYPIKKLYLELIANLGVSHI